MSNIFYTVRNSIKSYASSSNILIVATILALACANIPGISDLYKSVWDIPVRLQIGDFNLFSHHGEPLSLLQFINDAMMAIFFFSIGLEIKRESLIGELSSIRQALLPVIAACGGMIFPVIVFFLIGQAEHGDFIRGCAIPMATDIAFSLGVLTMLGKRVPISLKIFLTTLAVADDIGGILVIAIFYSQTPNLLYLAISAGIIAVLVIGNLLGLRSKAFYLILGLVVWFLFLNSGIHPTIAGVIIALTIPATPRVTPKKYLIKIKENISRFPALDAEDLNTKTMLNHEQMDWLNEIRSSTEKMLSPVQDLENSLQSIVNFFIIPLFAFANAGIFLLDLTPEAVYSGVALSIIGGLVIGKFSGIFLFTWLTIKLKIADMPNHSNWKMIASVSMLGGIGFTVSLFIATLSYPVSQGAHFVELLNDSKLGIILGSVISGFIGYWMLHKTLPKAEELNEEEMD